MSRKNHLSTLSPAGTRRAMMLAILAVTLGALLCGCGPAQVSSRHEMTAAPTARPTTISVVDLDRDAANVKSEKGVLPAPPNLPGLLGDKLPPAPGAPKDPKKVAREVVDTMSTSLVNDLTKAGFIARRLTSTNSLPTSGWLVRGVFT